jgi:hypothetical protein
MAVTKKAKTGSKTVAKKTTRGAKASTASVRTASRPTAKSKSSGAAAKKTSSSKTAVAKKTTTVKLNERQRDFLKKIKDSGAMGYEAGPSYEQRTIDALVERKLVKRGPKDKTSGKHRFSITKSGEKSLGTASTPSTTS